MNRTNHHHGYWIAGCRFWLSAALLMVSTVLSAQKAADHAASKQVIANGTADQELVERLLESLATQPADYRPRTEHFLEDGSPTYLNRLIAEQSPYLLQHAHNPVNWYPWGREAFDAAKETGKPIFISIGYATCHWCHVMERESFENEAIAEILNELFIAIKVDREQLPDVDANYMTVAQMLNGNGGWPLSVFSTDSGEAFFAGTYFPPDAFTDLLQRVDTAWTNSKPELMTHAGEISAALAKSQAVEAAATEVGTEQIEAAVEALLSQHDDFQGGFGSAPKFPREPALLLLLEQARRAADGSALGAVHFTLQTMASGGIHDQVGGGFHRYAVDPEWLIPHFEKMLYTQALLARNYLGAMQLLEAPDHHRTLRRMLDYVLRDMTSPDGGFYSATDADSEGAEGTFFLWDETQFDELLSAEDAAFAKKIWLVSAEGNFEERNILHLGDGELADVARRMEMPVDDMLAQLDRISETLRVVREEREAPGLDDKIITAWNGLMITALAEVGDALAEPRYIEAALRAANRVFEQNLDDDGNFWRVAYRGAVSVPAVQTDYAFMAEAALALFDVTRDDIWLQRARELVAAMDTQFLDTEHGNYFMGAESVAGAALPVRQKDLYDSTLPSGNSVALRVLARLWWRTGELDYRNAARKLLAAMSYQVVRQPNAFPYMLIAAAELANDESGSRRYAARGKIRLDAAVVDNQIEVKLDIAPGWHINADKPLQDYLIGTRMVDSDGKPFNDTVYPQARRTVLQFEKSELALYEGQVSIVAAVPELSATDGRAVLPVVLDLQACNDEVCLAPESLRLNVPLALPSGT